MFKQIALVSITLGAALANAFAQIPEFGFPDNFDKTYYDYASLEPGVDCLADQVILKIKPQYRNVCTATSVNIPELNGLFRIAGVNTISKIYPNHQPPVKELDELGRKQVDLSLIYNLTFSGNLDVRKFINELNQLDMVEYAQPRFIVQPMLTPNDDSLGLQWYLAKIRAQLAWDLDTGDTNIVIGVVDGGTHFGHQDLGQNVKYNYNDPVDGIDNDNDGFIDNFRGWDVGQGDNNPQFFGGPLNSAHGTAMCGLAAASTNNDRGLASSGYKTKYLPIKMVHSSLGWIAGYEGLVYAADHGCHVINASWGNNYPAPYDHDVVNYVTINQGKLLVAAAGNSNNTVPFYPAGYENVICVGGTGTMDVKSGNSSYYELVDVVAPGENMLEVYDVIYTTSGGTSNSSALLSGAAGLIQSYFTNLLPVQIGSIIKQSAYRIDTISGNAFYANKQGSGRLDMYAALTNHFEPYLFLTAREFTDHNDNVIMIGDTVELWGNLVNYLDTSLSTLTATITDNSPYVQWLDSTVNPGVINTMSFTNLNAQHFVFRILPGCPVNQDVLMKVVYSQGADTLNTQYFSFTVNRNYYNVRVNKLHTTVTTTGRIGFADNRTTKGAGYRMQGFENNLLGIYYNPMGLFISKGAGVSDQTLSASIGACCNYPNDGDLVSVQSMIVNTNPVIGDLQITSQYNDSGAGINAVGVNVKQKLYGWNDSINDQFLILEYQFENNSGTAIGEWYTGIFADFDLPDTLLWNLAQNKTFYDTVSQIAVSQNITPRFVVGYKILSAMGPVKYYANNNDGSGGTQNILNGFTDTEKFTFMNPGVTSDISGITDVSQYLGVKMDSLGINGCAMMHIALLIGTELDDLRAQGVQAQTTFNALFNIWTGAGNNSNWHNPANWSQGSVPDYNDHVIIPDVTSGSGFSPVISTADGNVKNIEVRCGGKLDINPPFILKVGN